MSRANNKRVSGQAHLVGGHAGCRRVRDVMSYTRTHTRAREDNAVLIWMVHDGGTLNDVHAAAASPRRHRRHRRSSHLSSSPKETWAWIDRTDNEANGGREEGVKAEVA